MKTGFFPIKVKLKLFFVWKIAFDFKHPYTVQEKRNREIAYTSSAELQAAILARYPPMQLAPAEPQEPPQGGMAQTHTPIKDRPFHKPSLWTGKRLDCS